MLLNASKEVYDIIVQLIIHLHIHKYLLSTNYMTDTLFTFTGKRTNKMLLSMF